MLLSFEASTQDVMAVALFFLPTPLWYVPTPQGFHRGASAGLGGLALDAAPYGCVGNSSAVISILDKEAYAG